MEQKKIIKLSKKNIDLENLEKAKNILEKDYEISYGNFSPNELKKALKNETPFFIKDNFIIGFEPGQNIFYSANNEKISIDRMIKAVLVEDERIENAPKIQEAAKETIIEMIEAIERDPFVIIGKNQWDRPLDGFHVINDLQVGEIFLPPHSAVFNFLKPTEEQIKKKIVSMLDGININVYSYDNYIDNCFHEIGHLFWRDCVIYEEKKEFEQYFKNLKPAAIYEYEWERSAPEEMFCTIYKWYLKSILLNKSFYNILEYEEPKGLELLQSVIDRIAKDKIVSDIFDTKKDLIMKYMQPGKKIVKKGTFDGIEDVELPREILDNVSKFQNGTRWINFKKAEIPVDGNKMVFDHFYGLEKADKRKTIYFDMDGVIAGFTEGYKEAFGRDAYQDDPFTIKQVVSQIPHFFRLLPVKSDGLELFNMLKNKYNMVFLTTPMEGIRLCRKNKIEWILENIGEYDVLFSDNKAEYVKDHESILIDDMAHNLNAWKDAGGTAIKYPQKIEKILDKIENVFNPVKEVQKIKKQIDTMNVNTSPTEKQKQTGIYKKGDIDLKGLKIKIENPKGSIRWGFDEKGTKWVNKMKHHYGYIKGTEGADFDPVDCFIGPHYNKSLAFVVNQGKNNMFDEHKIMLGFEDIESAKKAYLSNYQKKWDGLMSIKQTNTKKLRDWLRAGNKNEPF